MTLNRIKHRADRGTRALKRFASLEADVRTLPDEDLLDLVDIFIEARLEHRMFATSEMNKRKLSL